MDHSSNNNNNNDDNDDNAKYQKKNQQQGQRFRTVAMLVLIAIVGAVVIQKGAAARAKAAAAAAEQRRRKAIDDANKEEELLQLKWNVFDSKIRGIRQKVRIFETDEEAQAAKTRFQDITRQLLHKRYGEREPYRVRIRLEFPEEDAGAAIGGNDTTIVLEMGPSEHIPVSVYSFMEIARTYKGDNGAFHRRAPHVLQAYVRGNEYKHLAFQEYSDAYPHKERTVGYAGRPSGPGWYISIKDNTKAHGPGSQQKKNPYEADSCFGRVVVGYESVVVPKLKRMKCDGFCSGKNKNNEVKITEMKVLVPYQQREEDYENNNMNDVHPANEKDGYIPWTPRE